MNENMDWNQFEDQIMDQVKNVERKNHNNMMHPKYVARALLGLYALIFIVVIIGNIEVDMRWSFKNWNDLIDLKLVSMVIIGGLLYFIAKVFDFKNVMKV